MSIDREQVKAALPAYEIGGELGRGGWGVVLEARHRQLGRAVAVKQLPRAFGADPGVRSRFVAEARVLASLDHPHIVPVYDYVEVDGLCLLVMEKLPGGTVWNRFLTDGMTMESSCAIVLAACAGLHAAHQRGVLHRDVKPENLMFSAAGVLKVTDFGIAKVVGGSRTMATRAGEVLGTPTYMAPEHALGAPLGPPVDVYAAGIVLYELLAGKLPFADEGDALAVLYRHVHEKPVPLQDVAPQVPAPIAAVVMRTLASLPEDRYESAEAFGVALADAARTAWGSGWASARTDVTVMGSGPIVSAIERSSTAASTASPVPPASATVSSPSVPSARTPAPPTVAVRPESGSRARHAPAEGGPAPHGPPRSRRALLGVVAAVIVAGLVAGGLLLSGGSKKKGATSTTVSPVTTTAGAAEQVLYQDDFSNQASGWTQINNERTQIGYAGGTYRVIVRQPDFRTTSDTELEGPAFRQDLVALGNVAIEADAETTSAVDTRFGLICRRTPTGEFYAGTLDNRGQARIERIGGSQGNRTIGEVPIPPADVAGRKRLRLECSAGTFRLFVDGKLTASGVDPSPLGPGTAGVIVSAQAQAGSEAFFDNFVIKPL